MSRLLESLLQAIAEKQPVALGIISGTRGSSPQRKGAKALFFADGRIVGTLGGGCLEAEVRERARLSLLKNEPATFELVLDHDFGWDDGLICGGKVFGLILPNVGQAEAVWHELLHPAETLSWGVRRDFSVALVVNKTRTDDWLYQETVSPPLGLWIAGSGHMAQAVAPLALNLGFEVTAFDDRPDLANHQNFPPRTRLRVSSWTQLLNEPLPSHPTFGLIMTRGHQHDALVLREWIQRPFAFLGMIGSRRKRRLIFTQFVEEGIATEQQLERVACPVGLEIQAVEVGEIAVSVMGQLIQERSRMRTMNSVVDGNAKLRS
jgi:xanthine dehydrogenase accessory factor